MVTYNHPSKIHQEFWDRSKKKQSRDELRDCSKKFVLNLTKKEQGSSGGTNFTSFSKDTWTWFLRTWIFGCLRLNDSELWFYMNNWTMVFFWILDYTGWIGRFGFSGSCRFFFGSLDQVFLLDIGVLVSNQS